MNCGSEVNGAFCTACGQSVTVTRYTIKGFGNEIYDQFRKFDAMKLLRTVMHLLVRPGPFVREYLHGMRVDYQGPIKFFFYGFVLQVSAAFAIHLIFGRDLAALASGADLKSQIVSFVGTIFWGVCWWIVYRRSGFNFAENVVAAIYFTGQTFIYSIVLHVLIGAFVVDEVVEGSTFAITFGVIYLVYSIHFTHGLFREPVWKQILKQILASIIYVVVLMTIIFGLVATKTESIIQPSNSSTTNKR
ncbi:MAG TPA: DUF3667 domain-containing protein [Pyrinomonadaceae bacterium]|nr:DUF3667 domain-containing protein [Pyrinomonadaceae bacterium]